MRRHLPLERRTGSPAGCGPQRADQGPRGGPRRGAAALLAAVACWSCNGWVHERVAPRPGTAPLTLLLTDSGGAPLPGVTLNVGGTALTTDAAGRATGQLAEGGYLAALAAPPPGLMDDWRPVQVVAGRDEAVRWSLPAADDSDVRLLFAGDVSFEGGLADPNRDGLTSDSLVPDGPGAGAAAQHLLEGVAPLLGHFDLVTGSLTTALGSGATPHPLKPDRARAHPSVAAGLQASGLAAVTLANAHAWDYLDQGLQETLSALDAAGVLHLGAGRDLGEATAPLSTTRNGLEIAQVAASATLGHGTTPRTDTPPYFEATAARGGVAPATRLSVRTAVQQAGTGASFVVAHLDVGDEWLPQDQPFADLSDEAADAGAGLVVGHGPRPQQGLRLSQGVLVSRGLGQLVFGSNRPEARYGYALEVVVRHRHVMAARVWPLALVQYRPLLATGALGERIVRQVGSRSEGLVVAPVEGRGEVVLGASAGWDDARARARTSVVGGASEPLALLAPRDSVVEGVEVLSGPDGVQLELGRELVWEGGFEDEVAGGAGLGLAAGWSQSGGPDTGVSDRAVRTGRLALELVRKAANVQGVAVRGQGLRVLRAGHRYTFRGCWRLDGEAVAHAQLAVYPSRAVGVRPTGAVAVAQQAPGAGDFACFSSEVTPDVDLLATPELQLERPRVDAAHLFVDDVSLIEWEPQPAGAVELARVTDLEYARVVAPADGPAELAWVTRRWRPRR